MSKDVLVNYVSEAMEITKKDAGLAVDTVLDAIMNSIVKAESDFSIYGFGKFTKKFKEAHEGRNPRTGETIQVPAKTVVRFSPMKALKEAVNS